MLMTEDPPISRRTTSFAIRGEEGYTKKPLQVRSSGEIHHVSITRKLQARAYTSCESCYSFKFPPLLWKKAPSLRRPSSSEASVMTWMRVSFTTTSLHSVRGYSLLQVISFNLPSRRYHRSSTTTSHNKSQPTHWSVNSTSLLRNFNSSSMKTPSIGVSLS